MSLESHGFLSWKHLFFLQGSLKESGTLPHWLLLWLFVSPDPKNILPYTCWDSWNYQQAAKVWAEMEASSPQPTLWENILREKLQCLCPLARLSAGTAPLLTAHNDPVRKWIKSVHLSIWLLFSPHQHCGLIFYRNCIILYNTTEAQNDLGWKGP